MPTAGTQQQLVDFMAAPTTPPFLMLPVSDPFVSTILSNPDYSMDPEHDILPALVIVNWDGTVISKTGVPDILQKGDGALSGWQMARKVEDNGGEGMVAAPEVYEGGSKTTVGGVKLDLPF